MNALEIKNLTKAYPGFTLDHLNLTLPSGCIMGLIGFICGADVFTLTFLRSQLPTDIRPNGILTALTIAGISVYILSWYLSILFFKKREL